ncbi:MAG: hypothetical protein Ct9H300mP19_07610 [Dehalococcoidia bacterium]|nr:MAG: hypothetical protein Ct9H300mP19_07610 [Dehalococcoidia bacterium]
MLDGWADRPFITAALVRSVETAEAALRDGADGIIIFWPILKDMMQSHLTDEWNKTFLESGIQWMTRGSWMISQCSRTKENSKA